MKPSSSEIGGAALAEARAVSSVRVGDHLLVVEHREDGGVLRLAAPDGTLPIEIAVTREGAVLRLGRGLAVSVAGPLALDVETLSVRASKGIAVSSGGALELGAEGELRTTADSQAIVARRGDVDVVANDDVTLIGERIKLNS